MFRHRGRHRTFRQNIRLASLLSFVAGIVNVAGFFSLNTLTTNVTGHFAYFADELIKDRWMVAQYYLVYILSFLLGAFASTIAVEYMLRSRERVMYVIPVLFEIVILSLVAACGQEVLAAHRYAIACLLLFAMGMQNALVTNISNSVVRTTHLTGLFTDLGIEIAQLLFYKEPGQTLKLKSSIKLRLAIISFFFLGCLVGGYGYFIVGIRVLLLAALGLGGGLLYDSLRYKLAGLKRRHIHN